MSLKQWAKGPRPKTTEVNDFWEKAGGRPPTNERKNMEDDGMCVCVPVADGCGPALSNKFSILPHFSCSNWCEALCSGALHR
jgi:hypothetical protein